LVVGSSGALGSVVAKHLSQELSMAVVGADLVEVPVEWTSSWELDDFISLDGCSDDLCLLTRTLTRGVYSFLDDRDGGDGLDALICASGGFSPDPAVEDGDAELTELELERRAMEYAANVTGMRLRNLDPVLAASFCAQHFMNPQALMVVMGATAALQPTPGMMGYGVAKAAAHHVVQTLGASTGRSLESKSLRKAAKRVRRNMAPWDDLSVVGILPTVIDTAANRKAMPSEDRSQWTKPADIAKQIGEWIHTPDLRPHSGSLVKVYPVQEGPGATFELVR
jgi:dihydropteridine reductase